jgi:hypothetical protein
MLLAERERGVVVTGSAPLNVPFSLYVAVSVGLLMDKKEEVHSAI